MSTEAKMQLTTIANLTQLIGDHSDASCHLNTGGSATLAAVTVRITNVYSQLQFITKYWALTTSGAWSKVPEAAASIQHY